MKPIAIRLKNPLNLRPLPRGQMWQDQTGVEETASGSFCKWATWPPGWRAAFIQLQNYKKLHGLDTLEGILARWAPPSDGNDTATYVARVERLSGARRSVPLDFFDWDTCERVGNAMHRVEAGLADDAPLTYTRGQMLKGMEMAGVRIPAEQQGEVDTAPPKEPVSGQEAAGLGVATVAAVASEAARNIEPMIPYSDVLKYVFLALMLASIGLVAWRRLAR